MKKLFTIAALFIFMFSMTSFTPNEVGGVVVGRPSSSFDVGGVVVGRPSVTDVGGIVVGRPRLNEIGGIVAGRPSR